MHSAQHSNNIVWCYISVEVYFIGIQSSLLDLCLEAMDIYKFLDQLNDSTKMHFSQYIVNEMLPHMLKWFLWNSMNGCTF